MVLNSDSCLGADRMDRIVYLTELVTSHRALMIVGSQGTVNLTGDALMSAPLLGREPSRAAASARPMMICSKGLAIPLGRAPVTL